MKRTPKLNHREEINLRDMLGLEMKGLNYLTKQNLSKDVKSLDVKG